MIGDRDSAQAEALIHALNNARADMASRVNWLDEQNARRDAAVLRRHISEAEAHIRRLQSRYLGDLGSPTPLPARVHPQRRSMVRQVPVPAEED